MAAASTIVAMPVENSTTTMTGTVSSHFALQPDFATSRHENDCRGESTFLPMRTPYSPTRTTSSVPGTSPAR